MSCGTCPTSAQPTTRQDGTAPTPGTLLWSANVGAWYRQQRALGGRPAITGTVATVTLPAVPVSRLRFGCPRTPADAATCISRELATLTGHEFGVEAVQGKDWVCIESQGGHRLTEAEMRLLREVGIPDAQITPSLAPPRVVLQPAAWRRCAVRLQVQETARRRLPQFFPNATHSARVYTANETLLCDPPNGTPTLITRQGQKLHTLNASGTLTETFPTEPAAGRALAERRLLAGAVYCPLCGRPLPDRSRRTCGDCASAEQMV